MPSKAKEPRLQPLRPCSCTLSASTPLLMQPCRADASLGAVVATAIEAPPPPPLPPPLPPAQPKALSRARWQLDLSSSSAQTNSSAAALGSPVSMPLPSGAAGSPAMAGPSLPLTPERPATAPSATSHLLLRHPAAAIASTPAPGRAASSPSSAVRTPPAAAAAANRTQPSGSADDAAGGAAPPAPASPALLEARAGVQEADALLRQAQAQRRQLWDLADRLLAAERGGRWEAERALGQARHQVRLQQVALQRTQFSCFVGPVKRSYDITKHSLLLCLLTCRRSRQRSGLRRRRRRRHSTCTACRLLRRLQLLPGRRRRL